MRSAWISFVGRIVAQVLGATATIVLGLAVLQRSQAAPDAASAVTPAVDAGAAVDSPAPARARRPHGSLSIAVLPLENYSAAADGERFASAMTNALISALVAVEQLSVISRTSSMAYRGSQKPLTQIGRELGVDLIVEGSVEKADDGVRLIVKLIDAVSDEHRWAETYDRPWRDLLRMQSELARNIAREIRAAISVGPVRPQTPRAVFPAPVEADPQH